MNHLDNLNQITFQPSAPKTRGWAFYAKRLGVWLLRLGGIFLGVSLFLILLFRWIDPPTSSFMLQRQFQAWQNEENLELQYQWVNEEQISPHTKMAAISSEDQGFATHWGLDLGSIQKAINEYERGGDLRGASTITQQVAKNLFLWGGQSYIRKGLEVYFTLLIEILWSKERILEIYLNIVEFGNGIYGINAAAEIYFNIHPNDLSKSQSALMMTALPAPKRYNLANPSDYMLDRRDWIQQYMDYLGNSYYLDKLQ